MWFLPLLLSLLIENWLKIFFFTFNESVTCIDTPRVQRAEKTCLLCKIISSGETTEAGTADTECRGEAELSKYPLSTFCCGMYSIDSAYLKASQGLLLHQNEPASFCWCRSVILRVIPSPFPSLLSCVGSCLFLFKIFPLSGCFLGQFMEQHSEKCCMGDHLFWDFV